MIGFQQETKIRSPFGFLQSQLFCKPLNSGAGGIEPRLFGDGLEFDELSETVDLIDADFELPILKLQRVELPGLFDRIKKDVEKINKKYDQAGSDQGVVNGI